MEPVNATPRRKYPRVAKSLELRVWRSEEDRQIIDLPGPGGNIRIGVGNPLTGRSGVWRIWANKTSDDVYVANRDIAGLQKISLHGSGHWRLAWTASAADRLLDEGSDRLIDGWFRPPELGAGLTLSCQIWIPGSDATTVGVPKGKNKSAKTITWLPKPHDDEAIGLHVALWRPDNGVAELKGIIPVDGFFIETRDGGMEACLVFVSKIQVTSEIKSRLDSDKDSVRRAALAQGFDLSPSRLRTAVFGHNDQGLRMIWDLALTPQN